MLDWLRLPYRVKLVEIDGRWAVYEVFGLFGLRHYETWEWPLQDAHNLLSRAYHAGVRGRNLYRLLRTEAKFIGVGVWSAPSDVCASRAFSNGEIQ